MEKKGFTLIELLVVVAIIAILAVAVVLTLNPAQLLRQARDAQRLSDMGTLNHAIAMYLADASSTSIGSSGVCYGSSASTPVSAGCGGRMAATDSTVTISSSPASTTGAGWIPINFTVISSGAPFGAEPLDPVNDATYFYSYATNASPSYQYEIDAHMESSKFQYGGANDVESKDGGSSSSTYETGTNLNL